MTCSVAVASSPVFSPSRIGLSCKTSPESLTLSLISASAASDGSPSTASLSSSSPLRRFQRGACGLRTFSKEISASDFPGFDSSSASASPASESSSFSLASGPTSSCSSSFLKRKRPARLDIPMIGMRAFDPPGTDGRREVEVESTRYSVYCKRGRKRVEMEDRHSAALDLGGDPHMAFFGVFDGHGGSRAAEFVSENIGERILEGVMARREAYAGIGVEEAVKNGYLKTDAEFLSLDMEGGACCVTAFVESGNLIVSNAGDCRAVISVSGTAEALTSDHRPSREDEKNRIESLGGYVDCSRAVWRLQGSLAVSRGIGDSHLKQWVIPDPETRSIKIQPGCEFLILASDGLWDKVSNQEAVDTARSLCLDSHEKPSALSACKKLVELSTSRGSMDDITVMIVQLSHFI
ncbi:putative protein phosphatase 2C 2 [Apostasia shenzhenica]|uniref:protein-serine/threonine phosphatase n=1 Tax=Apostasia shenzhenica TaxID=1088818 RepID=A0A2I0B4H6_9ASPA|nr:putative protein phosphatase 2C 2 [Apostasia shenzhenica]